MTPIAGVAIVCVTLLAALVLVLRHLAAMRVTTGEAKSIADALVTTAATLNDRMRQVEEKLAILNNRTQR